MARKNVLSFQTNAQLCGKNPVISSQRHEAQQAILHGFSGTSKGAAAIRPFSR